MGFDNKLKGNGVIKDKFVTKDYGEKIGSIDYGNILAGKAFSKSKKLISDTDDDENTGVEAVKQGINAAWNIKSGNKPKLKKKSRENEANISINTGKNYSDKVFNQSRYQFSKRQKELWDARKQKESVSFFYEANTTSTGKFSKKLKPSKGKETNKKNETSNLKDKQKREDAFRERKMRETKMNERAQYERRYEKMKENVLEAKYISKKAAKKMAGETKSYAAILGCFVAVLVSGYILFAAIFSVLIGLFGGGSLTGSIAPNCWNSNRRDIDKADEYFYKKFLAMKAEIKGLRDADNHDEFHETGDLIYDHFELMSLLHAMYGAKFEYNAETERKLDEIFNDLFSYSYTLETEQMDKTFLNPATGEWAVETVDVRVLRVTINRVKIEDYAISHLSEEELKYYYTATELEGGLQAFGPPADRWRSLTTEYYTSDVGGMTVSTEAGRAVFAMRNGLVTEKGSDYIKVEGEDGNAAYLLSGINSIVVSEGDEVVRGVAVGTTGSRLKISLWIDGEMVNPLFYIKRE